MTNPAKLLSINLTLNQGVQFNSGSPYAWNASLYVTAQPHSNFESGSTGFYNGNDVNVGDYVTTTNSGAALKVVNIISRSLDTVECILEDEDLVNAKIDSTQVGDSAIPNGPGILFEVIDGFPVIFPLPDALPGSFNATFSSQLMNRFYYVKRNVLTTTILNQPNGIPTLDDSGKLDSNKVKGVSPEVKTLIDGKVSTSLLGKPNGVALLGEDGKIPSEKVPSSLLETHPNFEDLPDEGVSNKFYAVSGTNKIYVWSGSEYIDIVGVRGPNPSNEYEYITITKDTEAVNKQVISILSDGLTITLPPEPDPGCEIIIINHKHYSVTLTTDTNTIATSNHDYIITPDQTTVNLLYIEDWIVTDGSQVVNLTTHDRTLRAGDYWPVGTTKTVEEEIIYNKDAVVETWYNESGSQLAQQITLTIDDDNFKQIWNPDHGIVLEKTVNLKTDYPTVEYDGNLPISLSKAMGIDWKSYETFEELIEVPDNFMQIVDNQPLLNLISSTPIFMKAFIESNSHRVVKLPNMTSNNAPSGNQVMASSNNSDAYYALDGKLDTYWESQSGHNTDVFIQFAFPDSTTAYPHSFYIRSEHTVNKPKHIKLFFLNGFGDWVEGGDFILSNELNENTFRIMNASITARSWRFIFLDNWGGNSIFVNNLDIIGWNTKLFQD